MEENQSFRGDSMRIMNWHKRVVVMFILTCIMLLDCKVYATSGTQATPIYNDVGDLIATVNGDLTQATLPSASVNADAPINTVSKDWTTGNRFVHYQGNDVFITLQGVELLVNDEYAPMMNEEGELEGYTNIYNRPIDMSISFEGTELIHDVEIWKDNVIKISLGSFCEDETKMSKAKSQEQHVEFVLAGQVFNLDVVMNPVSFKANSIYVVKGKKKKLKLLNAIGGNQWKSSNPKVAIVSETGVVKGKTVGWTYISTVVNGKEIGTVVNVTKNKKVEKMIKKARKIYETWTYDQSRRTRKGYYDCSSLVWRVYNQYQKISFGTPGYAGWTGTESVWCKKNVKQLKFCNVKKLKKIMKKIKKGKKLTKKQQAYYDACWSKLHKQLAAGDIAFNSNSGFKNIHHVQMFAGCRYAGLRNGEPVIDEDWIFGSSSLEKYVYRPMQKK